MDKSFLQQLNDASRDKDDVLKEKKNQVIVDCHQKAKAEYDILKRELLNQASNGNYTVFEDKKYILYLYNPRFTPCGYIFDNGISHEMKGIFNRKLKTKDTGVKRYSPREPDKWEYYINELKRLGQEDGVSITAIMKSNYYDNVMYNFPTVTSDKRFILSAGLYLKCTAEF